WPSRSPDRSVRARRRPSGSVGCCGPRSPDCQPTSTLSWHATPSTRTSPRTASASSPSKATATRSSTPTPSPRSHPATLVPRDASYGCYSTRVATTTGISRSERGRSRADVAQQQGAVVAEQRVRERHARGRSRVAVRDAARGAALELRGEGEAELVDRAVLDHRSEQVRPALAVHLRKSASGQPL